jgi:DnaK suppressor protein
LTGKAKLFGQWKEVAEMSATALVMAKSHLESEHKDLENMINKLCSGESYSESVDLETAALQSCLDRQLMQVAGALHKLDLGTYGTGEICGDAINPAGLEALPFGTMCIRCKRRLEGEATRRA